MACRAKIRISHDRNESGDRVIVSPYRNKCVGGSAVQFTFESKVDGVTEARIDIRPASDSSPSSPFESSLTSLALSESTANSQTLIDIGRYGRKKYKYDVVVGDYVYDPVIIIEGTHSFAPMVFGVIAAVIGGFAYSFLHKRAKLR